ncbi:MAG: hypothetical protein NE334_09010 [Lentisphaeraceae bacterium]|nr:hypothetical protein [Lentisphaeraceae bacterium]
MIKYLILFVSGKFYFTSFNSKNERLQEFIPENSDDGDLSLILAEFCEKLTSNFTVYLYTDTLTLHTIDLSKQAPAGNASLVEQFLLFELENVVDILPDSPVLKFIKDKESLYHCLLTEESVVNDLKNVCLQYGGKLAHLGHTAGFLSAMDKKNNVEVFENTVHCQSLNDKSSFTINSSLPTEYEGPQKWIINQSLRNVSIFNLAEKKVIPLEGKIIDTDLSDLNPKKLLKLRRARVKNSPVFIFNKRKKTLKKLIPLMVSFVLSLTIFCVALFSNIDKNSHLENQIDKKKAVKKTLEEKKKKFQSKFAELPQLKKQVSKLKASEIVFQNVKFWPGLLENLADVFDDNSQLIKVEGDKGDTVSIQGVTLNVLEMQKVVQSLERDQNLNIAILDKAVKKERINNNDIWNFTIKLMRNQ